MKKIKQYLKEWRWMGSIDADVLDRKVTGHSVPIKANLGVS